jgi:hypothetical protein
MKEAMHRRRNFYTLCGLFVRGNGGEKASVHPSTHDWSKVTCEKCLAGKPATVAVASPKQSDFIRVKPAAPAAKDENEQS